MRAIGFRAPDSVQDWKLQVGRSDGEVGVALLGKPESVVVELAWVLTEERALEEMLLDAVKFSRLLRVWKQGSSEPNVQKEVQR